MKPDEPDRVIEVQHEADLFEMLFFGTRVVLLDTAGNPINDGVIDHGIVVLRDNVDDDVWDKFCVELYGSSDMDWGG